MNNYNIIFRADGSREKGIGLITRAITLADSLKNESSNIVFFVREGEPVKKFVEGRGYKAILIEGDEEQEYALLKGHLSKNTLFISSLGNTPSYLSILDAYKVFLHQFPDSEYVEEANLNIYPFPKEGGKGIAGAPYLIINSSFVKIKRPENIKETVKRVFLNQGGSDPLNLTCKLMRILDEIDEQFEVTLVLGPLYPHRKELETLLTKVRKRFKVLKNISADSMAKEILESDMAISAGGETLGEICFMGIPTIVVNHHERQNRLAQFYHEKKAVINLGIGPELKQEIIKTEIENLIKNKEKRIELSRNAQKLVDGKGAERIDSLILERAG